MRHVPVLRHRDFRLLFTGQAVSVLGDALLPVALAFAVLDGLDGSPGELGLVLAAQVVPMTFLVLAAGVWADRMSRRLLMLVSDLGRAVVQAVTAALLLAGAAELWHLIVAVRRLRRARGVLPPRGGRAHPGARAARRAAAGQLADRRSRRTLGHVLGPAVAGVLIVVLSPGAALAVDAATFVVSAAFLLALQRAGARAAPARATRRTSSPS